MHTLQTRTCTHSAAVLSLLTSRHRCCGPAFLVDSAFPERGRLQQNGQEKLNFGSLIYDFTSYKNKGVSMNSNKINLKRSNFNKVAINLRNSLPQDSTGVT